MADCLYEAQRAGGTAGGELSPADCDYIVDTVRLAYGRAPTCEEWADAGGRHVEGEAVRETSTEMED